MKHSGIDPILQRLIDSQNQDTGLFVKDIHAGTMLEVETQNSVYKLLILGGDKVRIEGNGSFWNKPTIVEIRGSTWGSSAMKIGWIGVGMCLEVYDQLANVRERSVRTSRLKSIRIIECSSSDPSVPATIPPCVP